jgi:hypothetical protein
LGIVGFLLLWFGLLCFASGWLSSGSGWFWFWAVVKIGSENWGCILGFSSGLALGVWENGFSMQWLLLQRLWIQISLCLPDRPRLF